jgi:ribosome-binding protein aMBF1 (putative translation factor)
MITPQQSRMARAALGWTVRDLAAKAQVAVATVNRFETGGVTPSGVTRDAIQRALEGEGIRFTEDGCVCPPAKAGGE